MKTSHRRIALLTGASIAALGISAPALAAPHDALADGVYPGVATTADTIEICDLATPPGSPCFFGVIDTTGASSIAVVNSFASGQINQNPAGPVGLLTNAGSAENGAIAFASGGTLGAVATASALNIVYQNGASDLTIDNEGTWLFDAVATAAAKSGAATANALLVDALHQTAVGTGDVTLAINNDGSLEFAASANALGLLSVAAANATVTTAIVQSGTGDNVDITLDNNGDIDISAIAQASGSANAAANANISNAIVQNASAATDASVAVNNGTAGAINITADADATATDGPAAANANITSAILQNVSAGGAGVALVDNDGAISVVASALASGGTAAGTFIDFNDASARINNVIDQSVGASGTATASVANGVDGTILVSAIADANNGNANAFVTIEDVIEQDVTSGSTADANAIIVNDGAISVVASALASGTLEVDAGVFVESVVDQEADAGLNGNAIASLTNNGSITVAGLASGLGTTQVTGAAAEVGIQGVSLINQLAQASLTATTVTAVASVSIANGTAGVISANFAANADVTAGVLGAAASANAGVDGFIVQQANALGAAAVANLANEGSITLAVSADAAALPGGPTATPVFGTASANATINGGILQSASALFGGDANVSLTNGGSIDIGAAAAAIATGGLANATASITSAISQDASAKSGDAFATLTNAGTIAIHATATATGDVSSRAIINGGILQVANAFGTTEGGGGISLAFVTSTAADAFVGMTNTGAISMTASANANDTGTGPATAVAVLTDAIVQSASATGNAGASIVNSGSITLNALANATAASGTANAFAGIGTEGAGILQDVSGGGTASAFLSNSGTIAMNASATALSPLGIANATGLLEAGIVQSISAGSTAVASLTNAGSIALHAGASASGVTANAGAGVSGGIVQTGGASGIANAAIINSGGISIDAVASAFATTAANASAAVSGAIVQDIGAGSMASALVSNSGSMTIAASAHASGGVANANANVGTLTGNGAISQFVGSGGNAVAALTNSGSIFVNADASAIGSTSANASAVAFGVLQEANAGSSATASISNSGTMTVAATAFALASGTANASAVAVGAIQSASAGSTSLVSLANGGSISVSAVGSAVATTLANARAVAVGLAQDANGGTALFSNSGTFNVVASGFASASTSANASAVAVGVAQDGDDIASFDNSGTLFVNAVAFATASSGAAGAVALGYALSGTAVTLDVTNSGDFTVAATAVAPQTAAARAIGMSFDAAAVTVTQAALIDGTIVNSGNLNVVASASGGTFTTVVGTGTTATTVTGALSNATATGIALNSGINTATITNSGSITVDAIVANGDFVTDPLSPGGDPIANGILVLGSGGGVAPGLTDILTINNSGDLIVRESTDGGATFRRGMAIDVALAPNNTVINLLGGGNIYGNIDVQDGDVINVDNGETSFDGIINPECMPPVLDGASSACGQGTLNITADGALFLRYDPTRTDDMFDGPAYAFVETFNMVPGATIIYELETNIGGTQAVGTYPQIFADVANIDGNLLVRPVTSNGLFESSFWDNVIDANVRNGTFDTCGLDGTFADSVLLELTCIYDALANVDLGLVRTPFDEVPGLTRNQTAVASGLECIFDPDMTGSLADVLADLFTFDADQFPQALDQLAGAAYASYLQSFNSLGVHFNDVLANATDCEIPALAGSVLECRTAPTHVWAQVDFQNRKTDGDVEAAGYDADRWTALIGFDMNLGSQAIIGASIGKVTNRVDIRRFGDQVKATGHQLGAYGVLDPGPFYVKALGTYNWFDGDSERNIDFTQLGGTVEGQLRGDPDVKMWTLGLHGGYRMAMGATSTLTPYLNLDYTNVRMDGFSEVGLGDVGLTIEDAKEKRTTLTGGVKWAALLMGGVAEAELGYRYQFGDRRSNFTAHFLGEEACDFDIISAAEKRGEILAGLSFGGKAGPVDVRVGYQGLFSGTSTSHAGNFKLVLPLGGRAEPPPAPEYVAPPPPPPPPPEYVPPPPPPPPPPPEPSGERG